LLCNIPVVKTSWASFITLQRINWNKQCNLYTVHPKEMEEWSGGSITMWAILTWMGFVCIEMAVLSRSSALPFRKCHKLALWIRVFCWPEIVCLAGYLEWECYSFSHVRFSFTLCVCAQCQPTQSSFHTFLQCGRFTV